MKPTMLMILDGYGMASDSCGNSMSLAAKPNLDRLFAENPMTTLGASGLDVGLPAGQMGNSEVGHLNIGAGRVVYQDLTRITKAIEDESFYENKVLNAAVDHALSTGGSLHLQGLLSDGGVHSHIDHIKALVKLAANRGLSRVYVHGFLDGRDVPPQCACQYIEELEKFCAEVGCGRIATISGRYYAMDRDKRWERLEKAYDTLVLGQGEVASSAEEAVKRAYERGETDEFVLPTVVLDGAKPAANKGDAGSPVATVDDGDSVIMFNFRPDRAREISRALTEKEFDGFARKKLAKDLFYVCMTEYDATLSNVSLAFPPEELKNTLGEYVAKQGLRQLRIAETEKYAHVTFFFNGGVEEPNAGEDRILVPSPKVATYDMKPEMSAYEVTEKVIEAINGEDGNLGDQTRCDWDGQNQDRCPYDLIILNFANADMVGHTGVMDAAIKAIETLDACVPRIVEAVKRAGGQLLITADHGNADQMLEEDGSVRTAHSLNPVPLVYIGEEGRTLISGGRLCDIAPTLLTMMGLAVPDEMTGQNLLKE